jgi:hypothetical protein
VIIAHVILKNDRRAVTVLFRAGARPEVGEENVSDPAFSNRQWVGWFTFFSALLVMVATIRVGE